MRRLLVLHNKAAKNDLERQDFKVVLALGKTIHERDMLDLLERIVRGQEHFVTKSATGSGTLM
jgi:hypothetical protein